MPVLVGYATAHGSTRDVAQRIASGLGDRGLHTETAPLEPRPEIGEYAIGPRGHQLFAGSVWPERFGFVGCLQFRLQGRVYGDCRNRAEIDSWAEAIAARLTALKP